MRLPLAQRFHLAHFLMPHNHHTLPVIIAHGVLFLLVHNEITHQLTTNYSCGLPMIWISNLVMCSTQWPAVSRWVVFSGSRFQTAIFKDVVSGLGYLSRLNPYNLQRLQDASLEGDTFAWVRFTEVPCVSSLPKPPSGDHSYASCPAKCGEWGWLALSTCKPLLVVTKCCTQGLLRSFHLALNLTPETWDLAYPHVVWIWLSNQDSMFSRTLNGARI